jgi:uncharacterized protein DUF2865
VRICFRIDLHGVCRRRLLAAIVATLPSLLPGPAAAENFFDALFGAFRRPGTSQTAPQSNPNIDPNGNPVAPDPAGGSGRSIAYCVRLCDGRYFPMQRHSGAAPALLCSSLCPASRTKVFFGGGEIGGTVGAGGERYGDLANAFAYRKHLVANCTCNGRDAFGLVTLDAATDPTLQPGDVVVTGKGLVAYSGARQRNGMAQTAEFTAVRGAPALPADPRDRLVTGSTTR